MTPPYRFVLASGLGLFGLLCPSVPAQAGDPNQGGAFPLVTAFPRGTASPNSNGGTGYAGSFAPQQIIQAYGLNQLQSAGDLGQGQTIAIVDAYGSPTIQSDLSAFNSYYNIQGTGTLKVVGTAGSNSNWALETSLDVEWAHAIAPDANIVLVQAASNSNANLYGAVNTAVSSGATVVSMSWGATEFSGATTFDSNFNLPKVTFVVSSGDSGRGVNYPAASPYVTAGGGPL